MSREEVRMLYVVPTRFDLFVITFLLLHKTRHQNQSPCHAYCRSDRLLDLFQEHARALNPV